MHYPLAGVDQGFFPRRCTAMRWSYKAGEEIREGFLVRGHAYIMLFIGFEADNFSVRFHLTILYKCAKPEDIFFSRITGKIARSGILLRFAFHFLGFCS